jgi:predicted nucleotidyltransferase
MLEGAPTWLEQAIGETVRWWALFNKPVTATEIWRALVRPKVRGGKGLERVSLWQIREALETSRWLGQHLKSKWGYWFMAGESSEIVDEYLRRHREAQLKWKITRRVGKYLQYVPLVRGLFGSGSLAVMNTRPTSDLDVLVVARGGRIWTTRLLLLIVAQLTGRRRRYLDREAPDCLCLNHYIADTQLAVPAEIHNLYTAMLYVHLVPLGGVADKEEFVQANAWLTQWLVVPAWPAATHVYTLKKKVAWENIKQAVEGWLEEPLGRGLEKWTEGWQRRAIRKHTRPGQAGRIALSATELAFHPASKVETLLRKYGRS